KMERALRTDVAPPVVFHLFGRLSSSPDYAICDEDMLEFLQALQEKVRQPALLFDELKQSHLLIIGCSFSDWLARFFIRIAKGQPLSFRRPQMEIVVDTVAGADSNLVMFLRSFSYNTRVISATPAHFLAELAERWRARHPEPLAPTLPRAPSP